MKFLGLKKFSLGLKSLKNQLLGLKSQKNRQGGFLLDIYREKMRIQKKVDKKIWEK